MVIHENVFEATVFDVAAKSMLAAINWHYLLSKVGVYFVGTLVISFAKWPLFINRN